MKYLALFAAYVAIMMNISYYYQLQDEAIQLSFWQTLAYVLVPLAVILIIAFLGIVFVAVGMHYQWWKKPELPDL